MRGFIWLDMDDQNLKKARAFISTPGRFWKAVGNSPTSGVSQEEGQALLFGLSIAGQKIFSILPNSANCEGLFGESGRLVTPIRTPVKPEYPNKMLVIAKDIRASRRNAVETGGKVTQKQKRNIAESSDAFKSLQRAVDDDMSVTIEQAVAAKALTNPASRANGAVCAADRLNHGTTGASSCYTVGKCGGGLGASGGIEEKDTQDDDSPRDARRGYCGRQRSHKPGKRRLRELPARVGAYLGKRRRRERGF